MNLRSEKTAGRPSPFAGRVSFFVLMILMVPFLLSVPTFAQTVSSVPPASSANSVDNTQVEIDAQDGIEWLRDAQRYIARGDATARRGGVTLRAETLTAYYRGGKNGERQVIFRLDADSDVIISQGETRAVGDKGVYHVDQSVAVLIGEDLRLESSEAIITADETLEYWEERQLAVARGNATIFQENNRLVASILTAHILPGADGKQAVQRIDALGGVHISTGTEIVRGNEGVYDVPEQTATVCGDVKITRGDNQLNGECAIVDMATGRARLSGGQKGERVKGILLNTR